MERYAGRCIRHHVKQATCDACMKVCPASAISWQNEIVIDSNACQDCGLCQPACPQGVFVHETYPIRYPSLRPEHKGYACRETNPMDGSHRLPCLGMLDETELVTAAVQHTDGLELRFGHCASCAWKKGKDQALQQVRKAEEILQFMGISVSIRCHFAEERDSLTGRVQPPSIHRRDFFYMGWKWVAHRSKKQLAQKFNHRDNPAADIRNKKSLPVRRKQLLAFVFAKGTHPDRQPLPSFSLSKVIDSTCNHCRLCTETCPTGALAYETDEHTGTIQFAHYLCTDCNACLDVCPLQALAHASQSNSTANRLILNQLPLAACRNCGQHFPQISSGQEQCTICQNRHDLLENIWASTERP